MPNSSKGLDALPVEPEILAAAYEVYSATVDSDDVKDGRPIDAQFILDEIAAGTGIENASTVISLFIRINALTNTLETSRAAYDAFIEIGGGAIVPAVFAAAASLPVTNLEGDSAGQSMSVFSAEAFVASLRAKAN